MNEKIKTISLIALLTLAVYLTQKIWIQFPEIIPRFLEEDAVISDMNFHEDIIIPEKYLINFGDESYTLIYDDTNYGVFDSAKEIINHVFSSEEIIISHITYEEYVNFKEIKFIEFKLSEPINSYILSSSLNIMDLNDIVDEIDEIHKIYFSLDEEEFIILTNGENHVLIEDEDLKLEAIKSQVNTMKNGENYVKYEPLDSISPEIYVPSTMGFSLPELSVSNHIISLDEQDKNQIAERFFSREIDYIREIVESNGSTIYEFDNNVLKLSSNGVIEYFHVLEDTYSEPNLYISISTAVDFLINRMGLSNDIYLSKVEELKSDNGKGYRLYFRYHTNNIPLIVGEGFRDYIQIDVFNNQIKTYRHLANEGQIVNSRIESTHRLISPRRIIENNYELFEESKIESIDLSYFDPGTLEFSQKLQLVWAIDTSNTIYIFDAYTGNLLYEK